MHFVNHNTCTSKTLKESMQCVRDVLVQNQPLNLRIENQLMK